MITRWALCVLLLASGIAGQEFLVAPQLSTCPGVGQELIMDKASCDRAGQELNLTSTTAYLRPSPYLPAGCFMYQGELYFNENFLSATNPMAQQTILCRSLGKWNTTVDGSVYRRLGSFQTCLQWQHSSITTIAECAAVATSMSLVNTTPEVLDVRLQPMYPPGCFLSLWEKRLWFNPNAYSNSAMQEFSPICKEVFRTTSTRFTPFPVNTKCSSGHRAISSESDCLAAAADLGIAVPTRSISLSSEAFPYMHPAGCYVELAGEFQGLWYNDVESTAVSVYDSPLCEVVRNETDYLRLDYNKTCEDAGYYFVGTLEECRFAIAQLVLTREVTVIDSMDYPRGCYYLEYSGEVFFNENSYSKSRGNLTSIICRSRRQLSFAVDASQVGGPFRFGGNSWGNKDMEEDVLEQIPLGSNEKRIVRWGSLLHLPSKDAPIDGSDSDFEAFISDTYRGKACQLRQYAAMLEQQNVAIMATMFGAPMNYRRPLGEFYFELREGRLEDWAKYIATALAYLRNKLDIHVKYLEITNEPNGVWDTRVLPKDYATLVKLVHHQLKRHGLATVIAGPGISDLGSSLNCWDAVYEEFLDKCYMQELQEDPEALNAIEVWSMHPWDDVYNYNNRSMSFLDEAFVRWQRVRKELDVNKTGRPLIVSEWGGLNLVTMPLAGNRYGSMAAECYLEVNTWNNSKKPDNIALSPFWAARAISTMLLMMNNGVQDALYWVLQDQEWGEGCLGLSDRAGQDSEAFRAFKTVFKDWPKSSAHVLKRSWPGGIEGRTEDVVLSSMLQDDKCRLLVIIANIQDELADNIEYDVSNFANDDDVTISVETYNNGGTKPQITGLRKQRITLQPYAIVTIAYDRIDCAASLSQQAKEKGSHRWMLLVLAVLLVLLGVAATFSFGVLRPSGWSTKELSLSSVEPMDSYAKLDGDAPLSPPSSSSQQPWWKTRRVQVAAMLLLDIIFHAVVLTEGGSRSDALTSQLGAMQKDYRELGRHTADAWICHAIRLGVLGVVAVGHLIEPNLLPLRGVFSHTRPVLIASVLYNCAKAMCRYNVPCWWDLDVDTNVLAVPSGWFWMMVIIGIAFPAAELYVLYLITVAASDDEMVPTKPTQGKERMEAITTLRFFAAIHIVIYHFHDHKETGPFATFANWGATQLTFFFLMSGFVLAYQYANRTIDQTHFWMTRVAKLYPLYLFVCLWGLFQADPSQYTTLDVVVIFSTLQKWLDRAVNVINTPAWCIGPFFFLYFLFPSLLDILKTVSPKKRWTHVMVLAYVGTAMAAGDALYENWTGVFAPLNHLFLAAHFPTFLAGMALGLNYLAASKDGPSLLDFFMLPAVVLAAFVIFCTVDIGEEHGDWPFWHEWARNGMFVPVYAVVAWYSGRGKDMLSRLLQWGPLVYCGNVSFCVYLLQAPVFTFCQKNLAITYPARSTELGVFVFILLSFSFLVFHFVETPASAIFRKLWDLARPCIPTLKPVPVPEVVKIIAYYAVMAAVFFFFVSLAIFGTHTVLRWDKDTYVFDLRDHEGWDTAVTAIKWMALTSLPVAVIGLAGHILYPPCRRKKVPSLAAMLDESNPSVPHFSHRIHFRIVTRGKHPLLVLDNVEKAARVLERCLPADKYEVEVVTDNDMQLQSRTTTPVTEIVVPTAYKTPTGAKFKARALEYAIHNSSCTPNDWIVHQDEETRFDEETVQHIYYHCAVEQQAVEQGRRQFGRIGQGVILYGVNDEIENWVTTLADSIRVADDFGKFRLQFEMHEPLVGMHGSFVVASQAVEKATTFDHGMPGSVTEDAYFSLVARALGVKFQYIDAYMYEQSPFSILDFAKQRKRWFAGLWLVAKAPAIPLRYRLGLFILEIQWGWAPLMLPAAMLVLAAHTNTSVGFRVVLAAVSAYWCWAYVVGFLWTFSPFRIGWSKWLVLLWLQLVMQPFFALMEVWGVAYALVDREAFKGFHVVQKESATLKARMDARDIEAPVAVDTEMNIIDDAPEPSKPRTLDASLGESLLTNEASQPTKTTSSVVEAS